MAFPFASIDDHCPLDIQNPENCLLWIVTFFGSNREQFQCEHWTHCNCIVIKREPSVKQHHFNCRGHQNYLDEGVSNRCYTLNYVLFVCWKLLIAPHLLFEGSLMLSTCDEMILQMRSQFPSNVTIKCFFDLTFRNASLRKQF